MFYMNASDIYSNVWYHLNSLCVSATMVSFLQEANYKTIQMLRDIWLTVEGVPFPSVFHSNCQKVPKYVNST